MFLKSSLSHLNMAFFFLMFRYRWAGSASYLYVDVFPPRSTVYTVSGLKPSTIYNFSVNAINSMGESSYADNGAVLTVTTKSQYGALTLVDRATIRCFSSGLPKSVNIKRVYMVCIWCRFSPPLFVQQILIPCQASPIPKPRSMKKVLCWHFWSAFSLLLSIKYTANLSFYIQDQYLHSHG